MDVLGYLFAPYLQPMLSKIGTKGELILAIDGSETGGRLRDIDAVGGLEWVRNSLGLDNEEG